jgi:hypothetical protein
LILLYECDEAFLGHDGYRHLAAVIPILSCEYLVANRRNKINELINTQIHIGNFNIDKEINNQFNVDDDVNTGQNRCYRVHIGYISGTRYVSDMCEICV